MKSLVCGIVACVCACAGTVFGQAQDFTAVRAEVDFSKHVRDWDGFGVNYVEVAQAIDYAQDPQEYGGFSLLTEEKRQQIVDMVFGDDGLKPGIVKMFLDPLHQAEPGGEFDHETTTRWMRYFVREGLKRTRARGDDLTIITTLYGPPAWATKQKFMRGRDLDPARKYDLARYMIDWVRYLREDQKLPVKYLSLHNEGEDWTRWPADGKSGNIGTGHDYNLFWPPEQVVDFIKFLRPMLDAAGLAGRRRHAGRVYELVSLQRLGLRRCDCRRRRGPGESGPDHLARLLRRHLRPLVRRASQPGDRHSAREAARAPRLGDLHKLEQDGCGQPQGDARQHLYRQGQRDHRPGRVSSGRRGGSAAIRTPARPSG